MKQETFIVGGREFTCCAMNAFQANKLLLRLQKVIVPIFGAMAGGTKNLGDVDVKEAAGVIAANIDESVIDEIVLPMFAASRVYCIENKKFIKGETDIDQCFTIETLFDFYELVFLVARFQFAPFFQTLAGRFGNLVDAPKTQKSPASSKTK